MSNGLKIEDLFASKASGENRVVLEIRTFQAIPSFKNRKRAIRTKNGKQRTLTEPAVKKRMEQLEAGIVSALYSKCQTSGGGTDTECLKQLRTLLSELSDDSLNQVPSAWFDVEYVELGREGVRIIIEKL